MIKVYNHKREMFFEGDARKVKAHIRKYWKRYIPHEHIIDIRVDPNDKRYIVMVVEM